MCGRYVSPKTSDIERHWQLTPDAAYRQSFNLAPTQAAPIVRYDRDGIRRLDTFVWGFRPAWAERAWINARVETLFSSRAFASAARKRRCLVPAIGWYEWQSQGGRRQPYFCHLVDCVPFAFAGIWTGRAVDDEAELSFAIVTRPSTPAIAGLHDRMPQIIAPQHYEDWLASDNASPASALVAPDADVAAYAVSTYVNKPANNDPACFERVDREPGARWNSP
jgi:putative SOS response-associated peptidase YedK